MYTKTLYHDNCSLIHHDNRNIAIFKFDCLHMVKPVLRSVNWFLGAKCQGRISGPQYSDFKMAAGAGLEANLMKFIQDNSNTMSWRDY